MRRATAVAELHLVHGSDEALVGQAVRRARAPARGQADRSLMVADLTHRRGRRRPSGTWWPRRRPRRS